MASLEADELIPISQATIAENCYLDDDTIVARNGYRPLTPAAIGSGTTQGVWRFRPAPASARTVTSVGGGLYQIADATGETTQGVTTFVAMPFAAGANISAAALGKYLYIGSDTLGAAWQRMNGGYTLDVLGSLPKGNVPTYNLSTLAIQKFVNLAAGTLTNANSALVNTDYYKITPTATGGGVEYNFGADQNWTGYNWLMVILSPSTQSSGNNTVSISLSTSSGTYEKVGEIYDTPGGDAPSVVFCPLTALTGTTRGAARKIQFVGNNTAPFVVHGVMPIPSAPGVGPQQYNLTFYNSVSKQESTPSDIVTITYASNNIFIPQFHSVRGHYNTFAESGQISANPDTLDKAVCFNKGAGKALPSQYEFASIPTFIGAVPLGDQYSSADTVRLWRLTDTGWRLVKAVTYGAGVSTYAITDDQGDSVLTHDLYKPGGTPPRCNAMAARAQRLICAYENRIYISSYIPPGLTFDPFPQFPDIPSLDADGWAFDISPSSFEQVQYLTNGDALYILTNEAAYVMTDLTPNSPPFKAFERGCLGRRAACWAENELFYAAHDGVFSIQNRAYVKELSQSIRRMYTSWLQPDSSCVVSYQGRKLYVWNPTLKRGLRYDFVKSRWTRLTVAHSFQHSVSWRDPGSRIQNMLFLDATLNLMRWQPADAVGAANVAVTDAGTPIPAWVYATGYDFTPVKARIRKIFMDTTGPAVSLSIHTSADDQGRVKEFRLAEHEEPMFADLTAYKFRLKLVGVGGAQVRRLMWERTPSGGEGA